MLVIFNLSCAFQKSIPGLKTTIWETSRYRIECKNRLLLKVIEKDISKYKKYSQEIINKFDSGYYKNNPNVFTNSTYIHKFYLEDWTGILYDQKKITVINKQTLLVEENLVERKYSDIGTFGRKIYIDSFHIFTVVDGVF